jgi:hypothetical protein
MATREAALVAVNVETLEEYITHREHWFLEWINKRDMLVHKILYQKNKMWRTALVVLTT